MNQYPGARPSREAGALSSNCPDESEVLRNQQRILFHSFTFCITLSLEKVNSFAYSKFSRRKFTTREEGVWFPPMKWLPNQWCTIWLCVCVCVCVYVCACSVMSNFLWPPWTVVRQALLSMEFSRLNTGVGCHAFLQGIFPIQGSNPGLPHCRQILYHLSHQGNPWILEWVTYPFSRGLSDPGIKLGSPASQADSLLSEPPEKPQIYPNWRKPAQVVESTCCSLLQF